MKLLGLSLLSLLLSNVAFGQTLESNAGNSNGQLSISTTIKPLCDINNNNFADIDFGEFIGSVITRSVNFTINCKSSTKIKFGIDLGSNPYSTKENRRMPKDGKMGDVNYFVNYKFTKTSSISSLAIGGNHDPILETLNSNQSSFSFSAHILKEQNNVVLGEYSDNLDAFFEYY